MKKHEFQCEHLKQLPLRGIVAFAVRCARRVEALSVLPEDHPSRERLREDVEAALRMAEAFANGSSHPVADSVVRALDESRRVAGVPLRAQAAAAAVAEAAHAAASAWHLTESNEPEKDKPLEIKTAPARKFLGSLSVVTADLAARNAFTAALAAYEAMGFRNDGFATAALNDYEMLLTLNLGSYPDTGNPIDTSPDGPLGPF